MIMLVSIPTRHAQFEEQVSCILERYFEAFQGAWETFMFVIPLGIRFEYTILCKQQP
jgi:hypothetical protein